MAPLPHRLGYFHRSDLALPAAWSGLAGWLGRVMLLTLAHVLPSSGAEPRGPGQSE